MWTPSWLLLFASPYIPHGHCYLWQTPLVSVHALSNFFIAIAYFSIPIALLYFVFKHENDFPVRLIVLFGSFIICCGLGHVLDIVTLWYPIYWVSGMVRAATALISCYTAMKVAILLPTFLALKSPQELEAINQQLSLKMAEKAATEKELESTKLVFESAFDYAPSGMVLVATNGVFLKVNEAFCTMTGYSKEDLLACNFQSITPPDELQGDHDLIQKLLETRSRLVMGRDKHYFHKDGHLIDVHLSAALLRDTGKNPLFFIAHIQDISEQKRIHTSLENAIKTSEEANQAKSEFLAMMSHEIRTPMNALIGMTELVSETGLTTQQQEFVDIIRSSGNTLLTVINDILDFSKIESNKLELEMTRLDLYECVEEVLLLYNTQAQQKGLALTSLIQPANIPAFLKGDAIRLRQILSNLVSNSIKFTRKGEVSIQVQVEKCSGVNLKRPEQDTLDTYEILFTIKDTGIGIPPEKLSNLFKPFSQVDASTTREYGGTGLGLAICKRLVEMMHGRVWVESTVNEGSKFNFSIQLAAYEQVASATNDTGPVDLQQKRLLIINSNETNRQHLSMQAESWNLKIDTAESAEMALSKLFRDEMPDIIAINEPLPDMEGVQLTSQIRNFPNYQTIPIVLIQSQQSPSRRLSILGSRVKALKKPIRRSQFYNALVQLLLDDEETMPTLTKTQLESSPAQAKRPLRILLTEDIPLNQKVALTMLSSLGYEADIANNGIEAVEAVRNKTYDLIFMDVQMPKMDGLEATRTIRTQCIQQPYIVAMTAHAMQGDRGECLAAGMSNYLSKPIRKQHLADMLQQCPQIAEDGFDVEEVDSGPTPMATLGETTTASPDNQCASQLETRAQSSPKSELELQNIPILNIEILEGISTERDFLLEITQSFLSDAPRRIVALETAMEKEDPNEIRTTAHALKSLSSCVGAMSLFHVCKFIEEAGRNNHPRSAKPMMREVSSQYRKAHVAIAHYQQQL
ncbi:MAG: response regulator [Cyanobacteria bacterium J06560_6]